ncbi:hypothetical protein E4U32_003405 [Claviceps aff. humidiphila group G2b]|nr:hypothetical protein E4U32_003405 [Claviceps aff. humidiphila group G2b]
MLADDVIAVEARNVVVIRDPRTISRWQLAALVDQFSETSARLRYSVVHIHIEKYFANNMISLPMFLFADWVGLFRNMYRAIEGLYLMPQYLTAADREKLTSLIPLALGAFGANEADIYKPSTFLCELEKGKYVVVNGVIVRAFIGAFVGDMMEQQLSCCMGH